MQSLTTPHLPPAAALLLFSPPQDAQRRLAHESFPGCSSGFFRSRRPMFGAHVVLLALQKPGLRNLFTVLRPNTGAWV
jgi:hypothetical protein